MDAEIVWEDKMTGLTKKVEKLESALEALTDKRPDDREERPAWMEER